MTIIDAIIQFLRRLFGLDTDAPAGKGHQNEYHYSKTPLLSPAEASFYHVLRNAVGSQYAIMCKVRLADVLKAQDKPSFAKVSQKHVDFLLCHPDTLQSMIAVELDDRSHQQAERVTRDAFVDSAFTDAGLPLLHIPCRARYSPQEVREAIQQFALRRAA